jgi:protein-glutamine gamma-glutamyltransferase
MRKELQYGLYMDNTVQMIDEKEQGFPIQSRIIQFIAIIIGTWGFIGSLMEGMNIPASFLQVNLAILISAGLTFALYLIPNYDAVKLFFGVLFYGLFLYSRLPALQNGFYIVENRVIERIEAYYDITLIRYIADYTTIDKDTTLLVIMIVLPVTLLLSLAVLRNHFAGIMGILLFLPISVSLALGLIPSERYLIAILMVVLYLARSSFHHHNIKRDQRILLHRINSQAAFWLSAICLLLILLLKLFISEGDYENVTQIEETKKEIQDKLFNLSWEDINGEIKELQLLPGKTASGGLKGGELGKVDKVEYENEEQLRIIAPYRAIANGVYLKGYVGSVYTGESWEEHSEDSYQAYLELIKKLPLEVFSPINQVSHLMKNQIGKSFGQELSNFHTGEMTVEYATANRKYMYAPYFTDFTVEENITYEQDLYAAPINRRKSYTFQYYYSTTPMGISFNILPFMYFYYDIPMDEDYFKKEILYRNFVYKTYTQLPEVGLEQLRQELEPIKQQLARASINEKIRYIKNYLTSNTKYSLSPGTLPKDKDFVEYFLFENKQGYCAHYASAAALMLRMLGVPTRYAEGYAVDTADLRLNVIHDVKSDSTSDMEQIQVSVKDNNAHAWVEVYIDECGWFPVDFTPGSEIGYSSLEEFLAGDQEPEPTPTPTATPTPTPEPTKAPQMTEEDKKTPEEKKPEVPKENTSGKSDDVTTAQQQKQTDHFFLLLVLLIIAAIFLCISLLYLRKNRRYANTRDYNKRAIYLYVQMEQILNVTHRLKKQGLILEEAEEYIKDCCPYIDETVFTSCMETVRRARFGKNSITKKELKELEGFCMQLRDQVEKELPIGRRIYLRLLLTI